MRPMSQHPSRVQAVVLWGAFFCATMVCHDLSAAPVCALIDTTKLPVTAILEARLLTDDKATWVERTEIDRVLGEQELQAAFGAEGVKQRSSLGKLLKAEVLILLRPAKNPDENGPPLIDCVVCETKRGLRLRMLTVLSDKNAEETAGALEGLIQQGLKKYQEKIESIIAVPPFLSEDLGLEFNYLQSAYARLVEERLLEQPGLLVVELKEAQAIAKELALDSEGGTLQKSKPPLYVMGRYRHDGVGKERTTRMSIRLLQGDKQVTLKGVKDLNIVDAPAWISRKTTDILPLIREGATTTAEFSPQVEAKRLAERGQQFQKVGSWQEALELFEASLLLDSSQEDVRRSAINTISRMILANLEINKNFALAKYTFQLYHRTLEHMELFLRTSTEISYSDTVKTENLSLLFEVWIGSQISSACHPVYQKNYISDVRDLLAKERHIRKDTYLRIARFRAEMGRKDYPIWATLAVDGLEEKEHYATILQIANDWQQIPEIAYCIERMTFRQYADVVETPAFNEFMDRLGRIDGEAVRQGYLRIKSRNEKSRQSQIEIAKRKPPSEPTEWDPAIESAEIRQPSGERFQIQQCSPLATGMDLVKLNGQQLCIRKQGLLEPYLLPKEQKISTRSLIYDGRYIWIEGCFYADSNKPFLWACDPKTGKDHRFTAEDGLPHMNESRTFVKIAPIEPGKICVVGYMGRSWAAIAELSPSESRKVDVFFEARETFEGNDPKLAENIKLVFTPEYLITLRKEDNAELRILVLRTSSAGVIADQPLLIDPHRKTVEVPNFKLSGNNDFRYSANDRGKFYLLENNYPKPPHLIQIQFPGKKKEELVAEPPQGFLAADDHGIHIIGKEWSVVDRPTGAVTKLASKVPWYFIGKYATAGTPNLDYGIDFNKTTLLGNAYTTTHLGIIVKVQKGAEERYMQLNYDKLRLQKEQRPVKEAGISP